MRPHQPHQPPHPSSSSVSLGFKSNFFAGAGFGLEATVVVFLLVVDAEPDVPDFASPLGSGFEPPLPPSTALFFFCACAASHPAKSGSEPSSKGVADAEGDAAGFLVAADSFVLLVLGVSPEKREAAASPWSVVDLSLLLSSSSMKSSMSPHASAALSSPSLLSSGKKESLLAEGVDDDEAGVLRVWRWRVDAEVVWESVAGRLVVDAGVEEAEPLAGVEDEDWISPTAAESLLVNEEMAQPAHEAAEDSVGCGVLIRGPPAPAAAPSGGSAVSGMAAAAFLILAM